jgi:hypothetical protein
MRCGRAAPAHHTRGVWCGAAPVQRRARCTGGRRSSTLLPCGRMLSTVRCCWTLSVACCAEPVSSSTRCSTRAGLPMTEARTLPLRPAAAVKRQDTGLAPPTSAPGLGPPLPHLRQDTGLAPPTFAPGVGSPLPHLHQDCAHWQFRVECVSEPCRRTALECEQTYVPNRPTDRNGTGPVCSAVPCMRPMPTASRMHRCVAAHAILLQCLATALRPEHRTRYRCGALHRRVRLCRIMSTREYLCRASLHGAALCVSGPVESEVFRVRVCARHRHRVEVPNPRLP